PDGTKVNFEGQVSVKLGGGGVNAVIEFTLKIALQSELEFTDGLGG
ncbi:phage tail protein, partial [Streptococcus pneumoniae]|nr:phage tail protein [Streptococcus pneumoniae]